MARQTFTGRLCALGYLKAALGMSRSSFRCFWELFVLNMVPQYQGLFEHDEAGRVGIVQNGASRFHGGS